LDASENFDPLKIGRYTVIRVHYEYTDQPAGEKLFIVLGHGKHNGQAFCWCIKTTSQTQRFKADPELMAACVCYRAKEISFFPVETIVDPSNYMPMTHDTLMKASKRGRYRIEGKMPHDFHSKISKCIRVHPAIEPKKKAILLAVIGEKP
jgi:hypothetical protein